VNVILRIALCFFLIQFLVTLTVMVVAMLLARPEVPLLGDESRHKAFIRSLAFVFGLPRRGLRSTVRFGRFLRAHFFLPCHRMWHGTVRSWVGLNSPQPRWPRDPDWGRANVAARRDCKLGETQDSRPVSVAPAQPKVHRS
jgi:hypothetical protein